jgi:hypothetical protein
MSRARILVVLAALAIGAACSSFGSTPEEPTLADGGRVDTPPGVTDGGGMSDAAPGPDAPACTQLGQRGCPGAPCCSGSCDEFGFCVERCDVFEGICGTPDAAPCCSGYKCDTNNLFCCAASGTKCDPDAAADTCCSHTCSTRGLCI